MPKYDLEEIRGIVLANGEVYCIKCLQKNKQWKWENVTKQDMVLYAVHALAEEVIYICDDCDKQF